MKRIMGKGKAKGTILFTVITVMMVMVVLLMTTLTLTSAANRRSYYNYFESQAQYAAQNAIDAITYSAYNRADFHDWVVNNVTEGDTDRHFINLEFDGSRIQYSNDQPVVECTIERLHPDAKWDEATSALHSRAMWKITATARVGHGRNETEATLSQYLYENFQLPAEELPDRATNAADWRVWDRTIPTTPGTVVHNIPLASSPSTLMFGNKGYANNMVNLGPIYANLDTLPLGWGNYNDAPTSYNNTIVNNRARSVGNTIYVNNILSKVKARTDFQSAREGAIFYGNLAVENSGYSFISKVNGFNGNALHQNSNYVYVDGVLRTEGNSGYIDIGKRDAYDGEAAETTNRPINLYCGSVYIPNKGNSLVVEQGDAILYNPDAESTWIETTGPSFLAEFVATQLNKEIFAGYGNSIGGNIFCNNKKLTLGGGNGEFIVDGDVVMSNPKSELVLNSNVTVNGRVISAGRVTGEGTVGRGIQQGANGRNNRNTDEYGDAYLGSIPSEDYDYSLMPFGYRIDEIFEVYYRWDLTQDSDAAARAFIDPSSGDNLIRESIAAGHGWDVAAIDTTGGIKYVPFTNPLKDMWIIPQHPYYKPADAVGRIVANGVSRPADYDTFVTGLEAAAGFKTNVKIVSHNTEGTDTAPTINNLYVITESCEIDLTDAKYNNDNFSGFFIDPTNATSLPLKIGMKGRCQVDGKAFYFIVNNTAYYLEGDYSDPVAFCEEDDNFRAVNSSQVQVMLKGDCSMGKANPMFMTTGAYAQYNSNTLSVVQNPTFPASKAELDAWPPTLLDIKYAYELVPNFTVFGDAGANFDCSGCNAAIFNCDFVMPLTTISVGTFNYKGDQSVTYREYSDSMTSFGKSYVWAIGSVMIANMDTTNDQNALCAYIGGIGDRIETPPAVIVPNTSGGNSQYLGENRNPYFTSGDQGM